MKHKRCINKETLQFWKWTNPYESTLNILDGRLDKTKHAVSLSLSLSLFFPLFKNSYWR